MQVNKISFEKVNFPKIICDYLAKKETVQPFYNLFCNPENFKKQINLKKEQFSQTQRNILQKALENQYKKISDKIILNKAVKKNITLLSQKNTWTITTGHQLNLFTGPLYFLYKIISAINLAKDLNQRYPEENFVPVYWMASEDHDFKEINHFYFNGQKITWNTRTKGAVGDLKTNGIKEILTVFKNTLNKSKNAKYLIKLFEKSYLESTNLSEATQILVHFLFGEYGLVVLDANEKSLKKQFGEIVAQELTRQISFKAVQKTNDFLKNNYPIQINPRIINLFYLKDNHRKRIILTPKNEYKIHQTERIFSKKQILKELKNHPERFSPNVILRPVYQEFILPNLSYIGGAGELSYWLQLKNLFDDLKLIFPILHLRSSALLLSEKQQKKMEKLKINLEELFLPQEQLIKNYIKNNSKNFTLEKEKRQVRKLFKNLIPQVNDIDFSLHATFKAEEKKQLKGWERLEKKLYKALKTKNKNEVERITRLNNELFPHQNFQERVENFSKFYVAMGEHFIPYLIKQMNPWDFCFYVFEYQ